MPIPLANNRGQLRAPQAQVGKVFDPSGDIAAIGETAANSLKLAQKAVGDMGAAIQLIQRQNEDMAAKEAYLKYSQAMTDAQTALEQHQGLAAEEWRNTKYKEAVDKAQQEFDSAINRLNYSDIRNKYVENNIESAMTAAAHADNYAYKERVQASNAMSQDIIEAYKRNAKSNSANLVSPNEKMRQMAESEINRSLAKIEAEVKENAELNGLTDARYLRLKQQEAADNFFIEMSKEISNLPGGLDEAQSYIDRNKGKFTTAAIDKAQTNLDEDKLVYAVMKDPMSFIKDGKYDEAKAAEIAPHLNDRERYRILNVAVGSSKKALQNGGAEPTETEIKALNAIGSKYRREAERMAERIGWATFDNGVLTKGYTGKTRTELEGNIAANQKALSGADSYREFHDNFESPAKAVIVFDRSTGLEVPLPEDETKARMRLAELQKQPDSFIIQDVSAIAGYNLADKQAEFARFLDRKGFVDEPARGLLTRTEYSTFDAITMQLRDEYGYTNLGDAADVWRYMLNHQHNYRGYKDERTGQVVPGIENFNFFQKGAYDELLKTEGLEGPRVKQIQALFQEALSNAVPSINRELGITAQSVNAPRLGSLAAYVSGRKRLDVERTASGRSYNIASMFGKI